MMLLPFLLAVYGPDASPFDFDFTDRGLVVKVSGVPIVRGSWLQFYEAGWTLGYYASAWATETVKRVDGDTISVAYASPDGLARATQIIRRDGDRLSLRFRFDWGGDHPAKVEVAPAVLAANVFDGGALTADGKAGRAMSMAAYPKTPDFTARRFSPDARTYALKSSLVDLELKSSTPTTLFDGRGHVQEWAEGKSLFWYGALDLDVTKGKSTELDIDLRIRPNVLSASQDQTVAVKTAPMDRAVVPDESIAPLIPKPKRASLDYAKPIEVTGLFAFPAGQFRYWPDFKSALARRFVMGSPAKGVAAVNIDGGVSRMGIRPGGYAIDVSPKGISILGEEDEGLRNGVFRLAQMVYAKGGKLWLPTGQMDDEPQIAFRGVHLFTGPDARAFHRRLWERVLLPLGMNQVVLQCERTKWVSTPIDESEHPMAREDLAALFADYRKEGIEPIPLIQSFGHMEWFFAGGKRRNLALNPDQPYAIDPRKPESKQALDALWQEVFDVLKPKTVHFGCDEVGMVGFTPNDPPLMTQLWQRQMPILGDIAKRNGAGMMIWGDMALAPGEAGDATNGDSKSEAAKRRAAIPEGARIADWHYRPDPKPESFYPTLQLWKREGHTPIASSWYRPENVRGQALAATIERTGVLQTTWCGYENSEKVLVENLPTFSAMVLAADYGWSGRGDALDRLGYDPGEVFRKMYFGEPSPLRAIPGSAVTWGAGSTRRLAVGKTAFALCEPLATQSILDSELAKAPRVVSLPVAAKGTRMALALDTARPLTDGDPVADVEIELASGEIVRRRLVYGHHIRAAQDAAVIPYADRSQGICALSFTLGPKVAATKRIVIREVSREAGLRLYGVTLW